MFKRGIALSIIASLQLMGAEVLDDITVQDNLIDRLDKAGTLKDVVVQTEVITDKEIAKKQASTFSEAITNEPGIQAATGCSMCGMKRIRINGLKGEHTTVLVDDVPMHSTVSSYYGMDAIATAGIGSIEVARGSGASLIAPGAIGGVINVKSKKATKNSAFFDIAAGNNDYRKASVVGTGISEDKKTSVTLSGDFNKKGQWDSDNNGVNESPEMENSSVSVHLSHDLSQNDNMDFKVTTEKSDIFGGPVTHNHHGALQDVGDPSFVNNDVREDYNGHLLGTLENITTQREELIGKWTHEIDDESNFRVTASGAKQTQDSIYEGDDYYNKDITYYGDIRYNNMVNDEHLITLGVDSKQEKMDASSDTLFSGDAQEDDFDMSSYGFYVQDSWIPNDDVEVSVALRADKINVDWTKQTAKGDELDETVFVPRLHVRWDHNDKFTSRFSAGQGYRAPLTFFESEHGILDDGFGIAIDNLEKSNSLGYSLSYDDDRLTTTASGTWTQIANLAYINEDNYEVPTLANSDETFNTYAFDIVAGYQLSKAWSIGSSYEYFKYDDGYKVAQFLAQIENRAKLMLDYEQNGWAFNATGTWIGSRDLTEYGYEGWNRLADVGDASKQKNTTAPSYYTVDMRLSKEVNKNFSLYAGVNNLFDYTQAGDEETPLFYGADGGYDVGYIYGPLIGRKIYAGIQAKF